MSIPKMPKTSRGGSDCLTVVLGLMLGVVLAGVGAVVLTAVFLWNITDIINVGVNFWNMFWLVGATITLLSIANYHGRSK